MILSSPRRLLRSRLPRIFLLVLVLWACIEAFSIQRGLLSADTQAASFSNTDKIFIASLPWNNNIIFRTHLINQIKDLVRVLGPENLFLSFFENGSYDGTQAMLLELKPDLEQLGLRVSLVIDNTSHADAIASAPTQAAEGWLHIDRPNFDRFGIKTGNYALRRIPYLSGLRNTVLKPLMDLAEKGERFDKILFLNDVVFSSDDILNLLGTRDGQYAAACTLDFQTAPNFYDTFALRDSDGNPALMKTWPYFRSARSRNALVANQPVPVQSCWNGLVAMPAAPFYGPDAPLRFRGIPDSLAQRHVEASECCLIHADNPLTRDLGVWLNPRVRVGYCHAGLGRQKFPNTWDSYRHICQMAYDAMHPLGRTWVSYKQVLWGLWENRLRRLASLGWRPDGKAKRQLRLWERQDRARHEPGGMCLIDEMQVIEPHGWLHV